MKIRVMVVDDQADLAEGIAGVLSASEEIEVVGTAGDGLAALAKMEVLQPNVVLLDIRMPNMNGVVATKEIKTLFPAVKVLILTTFDDSDYILNAINNGASGYLLKDIGSEALVAAIKSANEGDTILPAKIAQKIAHAAKMVTNDKEIKLKQAFNFSDREVEIALMLCDGFTNRQIAAALKLMEGTARNYISAIYLKINVDSRPAAIAALRQVMEKTNP